MTHPPVDTSFVDNWDSKKQELYLLQNNFIKETSTSPEDEPSKEDVERLCDEARREGTKTDDVARGLGRPRAVEGFTHEEAMIEIKRLREYENYVIESGFVLGFKQWLTNKPKPNPFT